MKFKAILSFLLILAMLLSFSSCGILSHKKTNDDDESEEEINTDFEGKYQGKVDLTRVLNPFISNDEDTSFSEKLEGKKFATIIFDIRKTTFDVSISCKSETLNKFIEDYYEAYARNRFTDKTELESALNDITDERVSKVATRVEGMFDDLTEEKIVYNFDGESSFKAEFPYKTIDFQLELGNKSFQIKKCDGGFYDLWFTDVTFKKTANMKEQDESESQEDNSGSNGSLDNLFGDESGDDSAPDDGIVEIGTEWDGFSNEIQNFGNKTIYILGYIGEFQYDSCQISAEFATGNAVNDGFYQRNKTIKDTLGLNILRVAPDDNDDMINKFRNNVSTGSNDYHALVAPFYYCNWFVTESLLHDIKGLNNPYLHLEKEWWDQQLMNDIVINDKVYFIGGDALISDNESTWCMLFNKDMIADNGALISYVHRTAQGGSMFYMASTGRWTLDAMYDMIQLVQNPTDIYSFDDTSNNAWGMVAQSFDFTAFMHGFNQKITLKGVDSDGREVPVLRVDNAENVATFNSLCDVFYDEAHVAVNCHYGGDFSEKREIFAAGKALFMPEQIGFLGKDVLKNTEVNFGILPMPKRDINQNDYASAVQIYHHAVISIPETCKGSDLDATCYALEAMAFLGKKLVTPQYYDQILQRKNGKDQESEEMLDLIFQNKTYDMGTVYNFNAGDSSMGTLNVYSMVIGVRGNRNLQRVYDRLGVVYQYGIDYFVNKCYA